MQDANSIYSLNKRDTDAIVYTNANGTVTRLTSGDFSSEQEFQRWKEWSDHDFHAEEKQDHIFEDNNYSLEAQPEHIAKVPSAEAVLDVLDDSAVELLSCVKESYICRMNPSDMPIPVSETVNS